MSNGHQNIWAPEGYTGIRSISRNRMHEIILAKHREDGRLVVLKHAGTDKTLYGEASKLGHEYQVLKQVDHPGIPKVYELLFDGKSYTLVQEFVDGKNLKEIIRGRTVTYRQALEYILQLTDILSYLHREGIIHKDINSGNVMLSETGKLYLIDFGISSNFLNEINDIIKTDQIEGTLAYISPEQTGKTAYSVTPSCDFYALGILFYELISGKVPFNSDDPLEVIHFHLSRKPAPLKTTQPDLPENLDKVIAKLLEKNPDDRYQSTAGLKYDLELILADIDAGKQNQSFKAGEQDRPDQYRQSQKLYGREKETELILNTFKNLNRSGSALLLVAGYSGVGKSALVRNVKFPIIQSKGTFISGKFDQFKKDIPYYAFISAIQEFLLNLLTEPEERIEEWRRKILYVLGNNAGLITEVIPVLAKITGNQEAVPKLQPAEQEGRFNSVLLDFIYLFSTKSSPLVIFLDDLQWADLSSLNLIRRILENPRQENILILGAYRDNEVDKAHPLMISIRQIKDSDQVVHTIRLAPLTAETTCKITADSFGMDQEQAQELGTKVYAKTKGNAFFIHSFLKSLYENKLIKKDKDNRWTWDRSEIDRLGYTDNVIDLMTQSIANLPVQTKEVLKYASALGNSFVLENLAVIMQKLQATVYNDLKPAIRGGFIFSLDKRYRALALIPLKDAFGTQEPSAEKSAQFAFSHDKVQQAAYGLFSESELGKIHLDIGRLLLRTRNEEQTRDDIFDLLSHFTYSYHLLTLESEKKRISQLFLTGGKKAKDSTAYNLGVGYLNIAKSLLSFDSWKTDYGFTFEVLFELGECEYLNNNPKKAEALFTELLENANTRYEKLKVYYIHSSLYLKEGNTSESLRLGLEAVKMYGIRFPSGKTGIQILALFTLLKYLFLFSTKYRNTDKLFALEDCRDEEIIAVNQFLIDLATSAYQQDQNLMMLVIFKIIDKYLKHGFTDASGWGFSGFSVVVLSAIKMQKRGFKLWDITIRLHRKTISPIISSRLSYTVSCFHDPWHMPYREGFDALLNNIKACIMNGDQIFTGYSIALNFRKSLSSGRNLREIIAESEDQMQLINKSLGGLDFMESGYQLARTLNGQTQGDNWDNEQFSEAESLDRLLREGNNTKLAFFHTYRLMLHYYFGRYPQALDDSRTMKQYTANFLGDMLEADYTFFTALSIASQFELMSKAEQKHYKAVFKKNLQLMKLWTKGCPANYSAKYQLMLSEWQVINGSVNQILQSFEKSIQLATENKLQHIAAIANERAALYCLHNQLAKTGKQYMKDAHETYLRWGAVAKARQLENAFPSFIRTNDGHISVNTADTGNTGTSSLLTLDISSVIKASQSISGEVKYDELMKKLMFTTIENAGAERGCLLLAKGNQLCLEAEGISGEANVHLYPSVPLSEAGNLPVTFIQYAWRSQETAVTDDASADDKFSSDAYIRHHKTLSMLCMPISAQGRSIGLLYLENNLLRGVFNPNRLEILKMLSGQIGISLENAMLYENLEVKVSERTAELEEQKIQLQEAMEKSDSLLLNILPRQTAYELKSTGSFKARTYKNACVMFCDIVDFTKLGENLEAGVLVNELHELFSGIDDIISRYNIEKIKTIGDAYLCASGLSETDSENAVYDMVCAALEIVDFCNKLNQTKQLENRKTFELRIGIHCGQLVAGIVGKTKYAYDIWGDTVNTASRMESSGAAGKINISGSAYEQIKNRFRCVHRGKIEAKGKGQYDMYFIEAALQNDGHRAQHSSG